MTITRTAPKWTPGLWLALCAYKSPSPFGYSSVYAFMPPYRPRLRWELAHLWGELRVEPAFYKYSSTPRECSLDTEFRVTNPIDNLRRLGFVKVVRTEQGLVALPSKRGHEYLHEHGYAQQLALLYPRDRLR